MHHHVFDTRLVIEMIRFMGLQILAVEIFQPYHMVLIGQELQSQQRQSINNDRFRTGLATPCWRGRFPSDQLARDLGPLNVDF